MQSTPDMPFLPMSIITYDDDLIEFKADKYEIRLQPNESGLYNFIELETWMRTIINTEVKVNQDKIKLRKSLLGED